MYPDRKQLVRENAELRRLNAALEVRLEMAERDNRHLREHNERLQVRITDLEMRVRSDSDTSHKPPSSNPPWKKRHAPRAMSKRRRGGQKGHAGHHRALLPAEQVDQVERHQPSHCKGCGKQLGDSERRELRERFQWTELPQVRAQVIEHRCYAVHCCGCGHWTKAPRPVGGKAAGFGPRLGATVGYLSAGCRLSKEQVQRLLWELFGVEISLGGIRECERRLQQALEPVVEHAQQWIQGSNVVHMDETGWKQAGQAMQLWTLSSGAVSVFRITKQRSSAVAKAMLGSFEGLLISDRFSGYGFWDVRKRQLCWAHIQRELKAIVEFAPKGKRIAKRLLRHVQTMFRQWARIRDGTAPLNSRLLMAPISARIEMWLERGTLSASKRLRTLCTQLLKLRPALFNFVRIPGAEPTNNRAERDLRHGVLWRRSSHGTQSYGGCRFAECMLSVVASLRAQSRSLLDFLHRCLQAHLWHRPKPLLVP